MFQDDTTGLRFGSFEVLVRPDGSVNELGRGGFGRTLLARHSALDTEVALKLIDERHAMDGAARERFLKEAREQARLSHPGIARITDCGEVDGQLYYAVELCPGGNIKEFVIKNGPLSVSDTFHLLVQAAEALEYSHRRGVVHLDIKPSNLMLVFDEDGLPVVKLIDFGLVQRTAADHSPPDAGGRALFSAAFASPEQIRSQPADGRSDLFSLGLTAWFLLTGRNPVEGPADQVIQERLSGADYEPRLPRQLTGRPRAVVARLLKREVTERYANGAELLTDLRACLQGMPRLSGNWLDRQRPSGALADRFMLEKGAQSRQGLVHQAMDREKRRRVKITVLRPGNAAQTISRYQKAVEATATLDGSGLLKVLEVSEFTEGWAVVEESPQGVSLTELLRGEGARPLGRYAPLIWQIGFAMDTAFAAGLTSVLLEEALVELAPAEARKAIDWSVVTLKIPLSPASEKEEALADETATGDFTRTTTSSVAGVQLVARWVYFIVGGKNPPPSSLYSMKEYIAVPGLGAAANQILAKHLCGQSKPPKCEDLLRPLFMADGISWESVGERIRQTRWGVVLQQSGVFMDDLEDAAAAAERISEACEALAPEAGDAVAPCLEGIAAVRAAFAAAHGQQTLLNQSGGRSLSAGKAALTSLEESSAAAMAALARAEAGLKEAQAAAGKVKQAREQRERRRRELVQALEDAWKRTATAAKDAEDTALQCRREAPSSTAARQMESLAAQTGALALQLDGLYQEALEAPETEWARLETRIPQARQVAGDADEMARACHSLLEKAKVEARRREEQARLREQITAELQEIIGRAEHIAGAAPGIAAEIQALAGEVPSLHETARHAAADAARAAGMVEDLHTLQTLDVADASRINQARQKAATAIDDLNSLMAALQAALHQARPAAEEHRRIMAAFEAAAAEMADLIAASEAVGASLPDTASLHTRPGTPAAAWLDRSRASSTAAIQCRQEIARLTTSLNPAQATAAGRVLEEARRQAGLCRKHAEEASRHWQEADFAVQESLRLEKEAEDAARAKALAEAEREAREEEEARRHQEEEAERQRLAELERLRLEAEARRLAEEAERKRLADEEAARQAAEEARRLVELETQRRREKEAERRRLAEIERLKQEAEAIRLAGEAERKRLADEEAARRAAEEARRLAEAWERRRMAEEAERQRLEEIERLKQEAEAKRLAEEAERKRLADEEAARQAAEEARRLAEMEAQRQREEEAERQRLAEIERLKQEAEVKRLAEETERRRAEAGAAKLKAEEQALIQAAAEAVRQAKAEEQRRLQEEADRLKAEEDAEAAAQARAQEETERRKLEEKMELMRAIGEARRVAREEQRQRMEAEEAQLRAEQEERERFAAGAREILREKARKRAEADGRRRQEEEEKQRGAESSLPPETRGARPAPSAGELPEAPPNPSPAAANLVFKPRESSAPKAGKGLLVALIGTLLILGGGAGAWVLTRDKGPAKPATGALPPPPAHTATIRFSGDALTRGMVSAGDLKLTGIESLVLTREGNEIRLGTDAFSTPVSLALQSPIRGLKLMPATLEIPAGMEATLTVSITRETGTVIADPATKASDSLHSRAILTWSGETGFAGPGTNEPFVFDLKKQRTLTLPSGKWSVTFDDDEPAPGKPGKSGTVVEATDGGRIIVEPGKDIALPPAP